MTEEETILPQPARLGLTPEDIDYAVMSLRRLADAGYRVFFAHDPKHPREKLAPEYYD